MKRPASGEDNLARIQHWRDICPEITVRSTFIVGFPGETEQEFEELLQFLEAAQLDRVGCFTYSPVEGASANAIGDAVPEDVKQDRLERLMLLQEAISAEKLKNKIGTTQIVLVDSVDGEGAIARSMADAPEIDGLVYIKGVESLESGEFAEVEITDADEHDLFAKLI